jgi:hypothetical protein
MLYFVIIFYVGICHPDHDIYLSISCNGYKQSKRFPWVSSSFYSSLIKHWNQINWHIHYMDLIYIYIYNWFFLLSDINTGMLYFVIIFYVGEKVLTAFIPWQNIIQIIPQLTCIYVGKIIVIQLCIYDSKCFEMVARQQLLK